MLEPNLTQRLYPPPEHLCGQPYTFEIGSSHTNTSARKGSPIDTDSNCFFFLFLQRSQSDVVSSDRKIQSRDPAI